MEERRQQSSGAFRSNDAPSDGLGKGRDRERERERDVARERERERDAPRSTSTSDRGGREKELQLIRDQYLGKRVKVFFIYVLNISFVYLQICLSLLPNTLLSLLWAQIEKNGR